MSVTKPLSAESMPLAAAGATSGVPEGADESPVRSPRWFELLPPELRDTFRSLAKVRRPLKGEVLIEEGDLTREILFVREGALLLQRKGDAGLVCVGVSRPGQGMVLLPAGGEYASPFTVTALVDSEVARLAVSDVRRVLGARPRLAVAISGAVAARTGELRQATALLYRAASARDKVCEAIRLVGDPCEQGVRLPAQLGHADLAVICGLSRSEVTRKLGELVKRGLVLKDKDGLVLAQTGVEQANQVRQRWAA